MAEKKQTPKVTKQKTSIELQFHGKNVSYQELVEKANRVWANVRPDAAPIEQLELYVKPEEERVYFVVNGTETGSFGL